MKHIIPYIVVNAALLSFAFGQSVTQKESADSRSEQEVRQAIEKYRAALLRRDIPALEQMWADDYFFVNAAGEMLTKAQRLANLKSGATTLESINEEEELKVRIHQNTAGGDEPRDNQGTVQWSTDKWPIPEYPHLGKRSDRMAISG